MRWKTMLAAMVLSSAPAVAGNYTEVAPVRPLTMSDPSGLTSIGLDFQLTKWTEHLLAPVRDADFTSETLDITADIRLAPHWVVLARLPFSHVSIDDPTVNASCCGAALGNFTVGGRGLWSSVFDNGTRAVAGAELSLSLPTASDGSDRGLSADAGAFSQLPHDPGLYAPSTTTIRLTTMAQLYGKHFLIHGEAGLQLFLYDGDVPGDSSDLAVRLALAAGVRATYKIAILAEINSLLSASNEAAGNDTVTSLDVGVRYGAGGGIVGVRVYVPLDSELRDLGMFGVGIDGGLRF